MPSLRCLISALTQAGGGDLLFWFASAVQSCYGEGGRCRQISLCVGSTHRVPATRGLPRTGVSVLSLSTLPRLPAALYGAGPALCAVPVFWYSTKARTRLHLRFVPFPPEQLRQPGACWAHSPRCGAPSPLCGPSLSFLQRRSGVCTLCLAATLPADVDHPESQEVFG